MSSSRTDVFGVTDGTVIGVPLGRVIVIDADCCDDIV